MAPAPPCCPRPAPPVPSLFACTTQVDACYKHSPRMAPRASSPESGRRRTDTDGMHAVGVGFGLGFLVALQLGPISLFAIRTTLRQGWRIGLAIGAAVLAVLAVRTLWSAWRVRSGNEFDAEVATPGRAFLVTLGATASNPLTIASWAAIFAAASAGTHASPGELLLGVGLGSLAWMAIITSAVAAVRRAAGARAIRAADAIAGLGMLGFAGALGYRTVHE